MAFLSYQYLLECQSERMFDVTNLFTKTALEVCEGQQYDMDFENRLDVTEAEYLEMIRLKTAVLLGYSLQAGALLANASDETAQQLYNFGINLGIAFQLQDDWLDTFGDQQKFGKKIGGDIVANKKTYLLIAALEKASEGTKNALNKWLKINDFNAEEKINSVKEMYKQLGIKEITEAKIEYYFSQASEILNLLPVNEINKKYLIELNKNMLGRSA
jgi:geranylgeranyl diphosphate synthase type II